MRRMKRKRKKWWIIKWYYDKNSWNTFIQWKFLDIYPNISHHDQPQLKEWDFEDWDKKNIIKNLFELIEQI